MESCQKVNIGKKTPRVRANREYESNLHSFRVKQGLTVKQLAEYVGTNVNMIVSLANGSVAPVHNGEIKPVVVKLCDILDATVEELFPRYKFQISTCRDGATDEQINDSLQTYMAPDREFDFKEFNALVTRILDEKEMAVIKSIYYDADLITQVASDMHLTREGVRSIEARALRRLRGQYSEIRAFANLF
jgi:transcriptional regulator with XRE-family HTH domain